MRMSDESGISRVDQTQYLFGPPTDNGIAPEEFIPILSDGMGVESTAILLKFLEEPDTFAFDLSKLIVIVASVCRILRHAGGAGIHKNAPRQRTNHLSRKRRADRHCDADALRKS